MSFLGKLFGKSEDKTEDKPIVPVVNYIDISKDVLTKRLTYDYPPEIDQRIRDEIETKVRQEEDEGIIKDTSTIEITMPLKSKLSSILRRDGLKNINDLIVIMLKYYEDKFKKPKTKEVSDEN